MTIAEEKNALIKRIQSIQDESILQVLSSILAQFEQDDVYQTSDAQKKRIEIGLQQLQEGRTIPHDEANEQARKWLDQ